MSYLTDYQAIGGYGLGAFAGSGCDVKTVQSQLNELGYNAGTVDGFLGKNTYTALQIFAIASGTPYTWGQSPSAELCSKLADAVAQKHAPPPGPQPQPGPAPAPAKKPIYINPAIIKALAIGKQQPGVIGWWSAQSTPLKVAVVGGATAVLLGALYATGVIGGSRRAKPNPRRKSALPRWKLYWGPEGRQIAVVEAKDASAAKRKAPQPYRKYLGEIYAVELAPVLGNPRRKRSKKTPRCRTSMQVQSLVFPKRMGRRRARSWAKAHGYRSRKVDARGPSVRLRQFHPRTYRKGTFRTIAMGKSGIKAVIGCKKKGRARRAR